MATLTAPSSSAFNTVKVNVRLCGSVPRQELESLSLSKCVPQCVLSSRTLNTNSYLSGRDGDSSTSTHHKIEDEKMASQLSSQLSGVEQQNHYHYRNAPSPEFEAPAWAVPANGESRLEVSMEFVPLHAFFGRYIQISRIPPFSFSAYH